MICLRRSSRSPDACALSNDELSKSTDLSWKRCCVPARDVAHIERTLDGLLDFCGHEPVLALYKQLCRHYWAINPTAAADYIAAYRERWDSESDAAGRPPL